MLSIEEGDQVRWGQSAIALLYRIVLCLLLLTQLSSSAAAEDVWKGVGRVVAIGDVHGDYEQFIAALRSAKLTIPHGNRDQIRPTWYKRETFLTGVLTHGK